MALFENFPYTNMHELNLDWLINEIKKIESTQVLSVNGQTGEVILYQDAQMLLPSVTDDHWSIGRISDGTYRGIMFGNDNKAYIVHGNMMSQIYGVNNPPPYPVTSVNGETGDVILYSSASVQLPSLNDAQLRNWNLWRDLNGIMRGIQFDDTGKAYLIAGSNRYDFYTSNNPPQYPVTSVNGQTGPVVLNIPDAFVDNPAAGELTIAEDIPDSSVWALLRETENGYVGIAVNNGVNPAAYLQIGTGANAQRIQLLTSADIPASAGVVSINGLTGVVTINGSQIAVSGNDGRSIAAVLSALDSAVSAAENNIDNIRAAFVYDENGNTTAAHNITSGSYVFWNNGAYKAASAIAIGDTLSTINLTAVPAGGIINDINNSEIEFLNQSGTIRMVRCGKMRTLEILNATGTEISAITLDEKDVPLEGLNPTEHAYFTAFTTTSTGTGFMVGDIFINRTTRTLNPREYEVYGDPNVGASIVTDRYMRVFASYIVK